MLIQFNQFWDEKRNQGIFIVGLYYQIFFPFDSVTQRILFERKVYYRYQEPIMGSCRHVIQNSVAESVRMLFAHVCFKLDILSHLSYFLVKKGKSNILKSSLQNRRHLFFFCVYRRAGKSARRGQVNARRTRDERKWPFTIHPSRSTRVCNCSARLSKS